LYGKGPLREQAIAEAQALVWDFKKITLGSKADRLLTAADCATLFSQAHAWLGARLGEPFEGTTVVVTHLRRRQERPCQVRRVAAQSVFVSDAEDLMGSERVTLWIHGHTHNSFDYTVRGTRVVCNPRGYAKQGVVENQEFDPRFVAAV